VSERKPFPPAPGMSRIADRDGTPALNWQNWFGLLATWNQRTRVVDVPIDLPSIPAGVSAFVQATIAGAAPGDFVIASLDPADRDMAVESAQVTSANTVTVWVQNRSGGAIDLAAGTLRIRLERAR